MKMVYGFSDEDRTLRVPWTSMSRTHICPAEMGRPVASGFGLSWARVGVDSVGMMRDSMPLWAPHGLPWFDIVMR